MINCIKINYFLVRYQILDFFQKMLFNKGPPYEKLTISRCDIGCDIPDVKDVESVTPLPVTSDVTSYLSHLQRTPCAYGFDESTAPEIQVKIEEWIATAAFEKSVHFWKISRFDEDFSHLVFVVGVCVNG